MKRFIGSATLTVLCLAVMSPALAQGVITDPAAISGCLCDQQAVAALMGRVNEAQRTYDADRAGIDALDQQIEQAKAHLDVDIPGQVDTVKSMNLQREQLYARTYDVDFPTLQAAIGDYNQVAERFTGRCAGRGLDPMRVEQVRQTLSCPAFGLSRP
jgi:hypothetical protein